MRIQTNTLHIGLVLHMTPGQDMIICVIIIIITSMQFRKKAQNNYSDNKNLRIDQITQYSTEYFIALMNNVIIGITKISWNYQTRTNYCK